MVYTLSFLENQYAQLTEAVFSRSGLEGAAYLLCNRSVTDREYRYLVKEIVPVEDKHYIARTTTSLKIDSSSYVNVAKKAKLSGLSVIFVHSHPEGFKEFSPQDNIQEEKLHSFLDCRLQGSLNGSLVLSSKNTYTGRVWVNRQWEKISRIRVIGKQFRFLDNNNGEDTIPEYFARQVLVFGPEIQKLLKRLHIGVIGAGGTGSVVVEQLTRLGVGEISVFDGDSLEKSNVSRVYGSKVSRRRRNKAYVAKLNIDKIGLLTISNSYTNYITQESIAKKLRDCDLVFGCTDNQLSRAILTQLSLRYFIPLIDVAVAINSDENDLIRDITGRVTTFFPSEACLFCRGRINSRTIQLETLSKAERKTLAEQRYAPALATDDPAVIMFTTAVSSQAISELFHRLTLFVGEDRVSTEVLLFFDQTRIRTNRETPRSDCVCQNTKYWGRGDSRDYLGMTWPDSNNS